MKKKRYIFLALTVALTLFMFSRSSKSAAESSNESGVLVAMIHNILKIFFSDFPEDFESVLTVIVRKFAHFTEYCLHSLFLCGFFSTFSGGVKKHITNINTLGFLTALADETIQIFSPGRAFMIRDILIDLGGNVVGIIICIIFAKLFLKSNLKHEN